MGANPPLPSALHRLLAAHPPAADVSPEQHALALQIAHNLRFQHAWTDLRLHRLAPPPNPPTPTTTKASQQQPASQPPPPTTLQQQPQPQLLLSGLPPRRLYVHPDEQIAELQRQKDAERRRRLRQADGKASASTSEAEAAADKATATATATAAAAAAETAGDDANDNNNNDDNDDAENDSLGEAFLQPEREWVLPSQVREKWSLRRLGSVFDGLAGWVPAAPAEVGGGCAAGVEVFPAEPREEGRASSARRGEDGGLPDRYDENDDDGERRERVGGVGEDARAAAGVKERVNPWRMSQPKRLLLATLDDDSTVVYYIVHDGVVKPRQN